MTPSEYVNTYLSLRVWIGDDFIPIRVQNYLQSGKGLQFANASDARAKLAAALAARLKRNGVLPATFELEGNRYITASLWRVYNGKGAPDEIQSALWLASICGLVDASTVHTYADRNLGIDCGGFAANYWGMGRPTLADLSPAGATGFKPRAFWGGDRSLRRKHSTKIRVGDAAIFFRDVKADDPDIAARQRDDKSYDTNSGSQAFHIGLVSYVSCDTSGTKVTLEIAESSGAPSHSGGNGVNVRSLGEVEATVAKDLAYCWDKKSRVYFIGCDRTPAPYMPDGFGD